MAAKFNVTIKDRKPYKAPILLVYGDIEAVTETVGNMMGKADGGVMAFSKTF